MSKTPVVFLKPGREKSVLRRHPWIFSGAVARVKGDPHQGETVEVVNPNGTQLGQAAYSPHSQIRVRMWTFGTDEQVDLDLFRKRLTAAQSIREGLRIPERTNAYRMVFAESDGLPGLIADRYGNAVILQSLTAGSEYWKDELTDLLIETAGVETIYERSDAEVRDLEGLPVHAGILRGDPTTLPESIVENGLKFNVDIENGHKTGFYLDQRENRKIVRGFSQDRDVLDCFCYTGGFTVNALAGRARSVLSIDTSPEALALCRENIRLNSLDSSRQTVMEGDVFQLLRKLRDQGRYFDLVVLDPPKFAPTTAQVKKAARGYKDINRLAFKLLRQGGLLVTFSCSGGVDAALFQKIVASAALDAEVDAQILKTLTQAPDHPVALNFPEGAYLKGLVCRKG